jgi:uncharacterized protein (DUF1697 family)
VTVHVALLRGINLGGRNKLPMRDLASIFDDAGCGEVRTYIQSGNVVFDASPRVARTVPEVVTAAIHKRFGIDVPVLVRTAAEMEAVVAGNPFADVETLHVCFLAGVPTSARVATLDPARSPGDRFEVRGREVYLSLAGGVARSKLTNAWFDAKLATVSTVRNWRTVQKLLELTRG